MLIFVRYAIVAFAFVFAGHAGAQTYPNHPLTLVLPYPPGGSVDLVGRFVSAELGKKLGQNIIVDNRPGASGLLGSSQVARAAGDGYTLLLVDLSILTMHPHTRKLDFDPLKDLTPVTLLTRFPQVIVVNNDVPAKTLPEFIALAKAKPGAMNYASIGPGSPHQLVMERIKQTTGIDLVHVPYQGGAAGNRAVAAGEVQAGITGLGTVANYIQAGSVRPLAVASLSRLPAAPDIPTFDESGMKGFQSYAWNGLVVPAGTDKRIVDRLSGDMRQILATPDAQGKFAPLGMEAFGNTPEQFAAYIKEEYEIWGRVVKAANIRLDN